MRLSDGKCIKISNIVEMFRSVYFIYRQINRLFTPSQNICYIVIYRVYTFFAVNKKYNLVSFFTGNFCLCKDIYHNLIFVSGDNTACINQSKFFILPFNIKIYSVTCDTGLVIDYGLTCPDNSVHKRGFSYIRSSYYGDNGFITHKNIPLICKLILI